MSATAPSRRGEASPANTAATQALAPGAPATDPTTDSAADVLGPDVLGAAPAGRTGYSRRGRLLGAGLVGAVVMAILVVLVPAVAPARAEPLPPSPLGAAAPDFAARPLDGTGSVRLSTFRGRPVVVNFWASWCTPCQQEAETLANAARRWAGQGVVFLGVNAQDTAAGARTFVRTNQIGYQNLVDADGDVVWAYGVTGFPETFFVDRNGIIRAKEISALDTTVMDRSIATILNG